MNFSANPHKPSNLFLDLFAQLAGAVEYIDCFLT